MRVALLSVLVVAACGDNNVSDPPVSGQVAALVGDRLAGLVTGQLEATEIEHQIYDLHAVSLSDPLTPDSCDAVHDALRTLCGELYEQGRLVSCVQDADFYYAHSVPRCAVRFEMQAGGASPYGPMYALDFTGIPLVGPEPLCGNGVLDAGEQCDDGNLTLWDGCDANCKTEEFHGCETVIERAYRDADLAAVPAIDWQTRRSQLMINHGKPLGRVDEYTCLLAHQTGEQVCHELEVQMPFVARCSAATRFHHDDDGNPACSVRFYVGFSGRAPDAGVFTTALPGVLAFTIE